MDLTSLNGHIVPYDPAQYLYTTNSHNKVSRQAKIVGSANIMLGGKVIIHPRAVIRGDLARAVRVASSTTAATASVSGGTGEGSGQPESKGVERIVISTGRYCVIGEGVVLRPPWRVYKGVFSYYPSKTGDFVHIGANSVVESQQLGSHIDIGKDCIIGRYVVIKDSVRLLDGSVVPSNATIPSGQIWGGNPARPLAQLPEDWAEMHQERCRDYYSRFRPRAGPTGGATAAASSGAAGSTARRE
ncbi:trimeric LpxA-like protein [Microstroma glucosiphilum]|uniref:Dynactin subunit 5 n=1 Tax=Pseudomicrostroma glucosiphilum TaxID=1684307 RepID=A0A316U9F0_9BASI|nr:trimeric LpxA-like protein [Pseudomicrostroma glucosiphilum]PWN19625.1 trimeric LpxA-like protein [Pseudomicrostroma glucosiphilum]